MSVGAGTELMQIGVWHRVSGLRVVEETGIGLGMGVRDGVVDGNTIFVFGGNGITEDVDCPVGVLHATSKKINMNSKLRNNGFFVKVYHPQIMQIYS
jgi:hypothetical protein